jgi:uncharacterized protein (UPF0147 family)
MSNDKLSEVVEFLSELNEDTTVPKNVKQKIAEIISILKSNSDMSLKVDKVIHLFDELNEDSNLDPYTRTQLWNVVSMLESL